ncbi:hypothetical protein LTR48_003242 [Friedmanniomyces endolithicus]|nr:hypothetical protein LTR48_003242 [Friedmanniomyces endolithicus]
MSYDRARQRRPLYAPPPPPGRQQSVLGFWVPLVVTSTIALGGLAAWIWSERSEHDDHDYSPGKPQRPGPGAGGSSYAQGGPQPSYSQGPPPSYPQGPPAQSQGTSSSSSTPLVSPPHLLSPTAPTRSTSPSTPKTRPPTSAPQATPKSPPPPPQPPPANCSPYPPALTQQPPQTLSPSPLPANNFDALYTQALSLVSHPSQILCFTTPTSYTSLLRHLAPNLAYVSDLLAGEEGATIANLRGWVGSAVVVVGDDGTGGLAETETDEMETENEAEVGGGGVGRKRRERGEKWYERSGGIVGLGKGVEVVDVARVGDDWVKRVGGRE